jgi:hypothetical protein
MQTAWRRSRHWITALRMAFSPLPAAAIRPTQYWAAISRSQREHLPRLVRTRPSVEDRTDGCCMCTSCDGIGAPPNTLQAPLIGISHARSPRAGLLLSNPLPLLGQAFRGYRHTRSERLCKQRYAQFLDLPSEQTQGRS